MRIDFTVLLGLIFSLTNLVLASRTCTKCRHRDTKELLRRRLASVKTKARFDISGAIPTTDDEDLQPEVGSGMEPEDGRSSGLTIPASLLGRSGTEISCCKLGLFFGKRGDHCYSRRLNKMSRQARHKQLHRRFAKVMSASTENFIQLLDVPFRRCSTKKPESFDKCCRAGYMERRNAHPWPRGLPNVSDGMKHVGQVYIRRLHTKAKLSNRGHSSARISRGRKWTAHRDFRRQRRG